MSAESNILDLNEWLTFAQCAKLKGVRYEAIRMFVRLHPGTQIRRVGRTVLVKRSELEKYVPRSEQTLVAAR